MECSIEGLLVLHVAVGGAVDRKANSIVFEKGLLTKERKNCVEKVE